MRHVNCELSRSCVCQFIRQSHSHFVIRWSYGNSVQLQASALKGFVRRSNCVCMLFLCNSETLIRLYLQSRTKLLEKVFPTMSSFLRNKTISKMTPLRKENRFPQYNVASPKRPGIRLSFEYITTLLSGEGGEGRTGTATMFRKMLS